MSKRKVLISVFSVIFIALFSLVAFLKGQYVVPILMYHSVNPKAMPENRLAVSVEAFERQMRFLKRQHYNVLPLEELAVLIKDKRKIPLRTVAITFDDGYRDSYIYAFPILKKYNLPAAMFVIVNEIGRLNKIGIRDRLTRDDIKLMQDSGIIAFGSHALGPEPLINIESKQELNKEIFESKRILEENLGQKVNMFSYPEGRFNDKIKQLVIDAGYKLAVTTSPGRDFPDDDVFALKRLRISATSDNLFIFWIETSGFYSFIKEHRDAD